MGSPCSSTWPVVAGSRPDMHFSSVVLPQPDGPTTHTSSFSVTSKSRSAMAFTALSPLP